MIGIGLVRQVGDRDGHAALRFPARAAAGSAAACRALGRGRNGSDRGVIALCVFCVAAHAGLRLLAVFIADGSGSRR